MKLKVLGSGTGLTDGDLSWKFKGKYVPKVIFRMLKSEERYLWYGDDLFQLNYYLIIFIN